MAAYLAGAGGKVSKSAGEPGDLASPTRQMHTKQPASHVKDEFLRPARWHSITVEVRMLTCRPRVSKSGAGPSEQAPHTDNVGREEAYVRRDAREHARATQVVAALDVRLYQHVAVQQQQVLCHVRRDADVLALEFWGRESEGRVRRRKRLFPPAPAQRRRATYGGTC